MSNRNIQALLVAGRVVLLQHTSSAITELAVVLGAPDSLDSMLAAADTFGGKAGFGAKGGKKGGINLLSGSSGSSGSWGTGGSSNGSGSGPNRVLWLLVLHNPGPMDPPAAEATDTDAAAVAAAQIGKRQGGQRKEGLVWSSVWCTVAVQWTGRIESELSPR